MNSTMIQPLRQGEKVDLDLELIDATGAKFSFTVPLLDNTDLRRINVVTWDETSPPVTPAMLREVRRAAIAYVEKHEVELAAILP